MAFPVQGGAVFDTDFLVLGVVAQLFAGLFLASAAGKGKPRHLLIDALGGTPRNLDFLRDAIQARARGQAGAVFLLAGAGLILAGLLLPGPSDAKVRAGGILLETVVAGAFLSALRSHAERSLRRAVRQYLLQQPFAFQDHIALTREIGELFGVASGGDETLEGFVKKVREAVGLDAGEAGSAGLIRRTATRTALR